MEINSAKLVKELLNAGIETCGCNSKGIVWDLDNKEIQDRPDVVVAIKAHDPTPISVETLEEKIERIVDDKLAVAK